MNQNQDVSPILPPKYLTVIISDYSRFVHMQEPILHRSVKIELTEEQRNKLMLHYNGSCGKIQIFEEISHCFIED